MLLEFIKRFSTVYSHLNNDLYAVVFLFLSLLCGFNKAQEKRLGWKTKSTARV